MQPKQRKMRNMRTISASKSETKNKKSERVALSGSLGDSDSVSMKARKSGTEKGIISKEPFTETISRNSRKTLHSLESLENGQFLLVLSHSGDS